MEDALHNHSCNQSASRSMTGTVFAEVTRRKKEYPVQARGKWQVSLVVALPVTCVNRNKWISGKTC